MEGDMYNNTLYNIAKQLNIKELVQKPLYDSKTILRFKLLIKLFYMIPRIQDVIIQEHKKRKSYVRKSSIMAGFQSKYSVPGPVDNHKAELKISALIVT